MAYGIIFPLSPAAAPCTDTALRVLAAVWMALLPVLGPGTRRIAGYAASGGVTWLIRHPILYEYYEFVVFLETLDYCLIFQKCEICVPARTARMLIFYLPCGHFNHGLIMSNQWTRGLINSARAKKQASKNGGKVDVAYGLAGHRCIKTQDFQASDTAMPPPNI